MENRNDEEFINMVQYACRNGDIKLFDYLVKDFSKLEAETQLEILKYSLASFKTIEFLDYLFGLLDKNFVFDSENGSIFVYAVASENKEEIEYLLSKGYDLNEVDEDGNNALFYAAGFCNDVDYIKFLVSKGADYNNLNNTGENMLIYAVAETTSEEVIDYILELGFDLESRDSEGFTPFLQAVYHNTEVDVLTHLVHLGCEVYACTYKNQNAFCLAANNKNPLVPELLASYFNTSDVDDSNFATISYALRKASSENVIVYLNAQKNENLRNACFNPDPKVIEFMCNCGYSVYDFFENSASALHLIAKYNSNPDVLFNNYKNSFFHVKDEYGRTFMHYAAVNDNEGFWEKISTYEFFGNYLNEKDSFGNIPEFYRNNKDKFESLISNK